MDFWTPTVGRAEAFSSWLEKNEAREAAYVMPDIQPFMGTDGHYISGRQAWREHLKATGTIELGRSDIEYQRSQWNKRKEKFRSRLGPVETPTFEGDGKRINAGKVAIEIANRLHGRPLPQRKELIKLAVDVAKRVKR